MDVWVVTLFTRKNTKEKQKVPHTAFQICFKKKKKLTDFVSQLYEVSVGSLRDAVHKQGVITVWQNSMENEPCELAIFLFPHFRENAHTKTKCLFFLPISP